MSSNLAHLSSRSSSRRGARPVDVVAVRWASSGQIVGEPGLQEHVIGVPAEQGSWPRGGASVDEPGRRTWSRPSITWRPSGPDRRDVDRCDQIVVADDDVDGTTVAVDTGSGAAPGSRRSRYPGSCRSSPISRCTAAMRSAFALCRLDDRLEVAQTGQGRAVGGALDRAEAWLYLQPNSFASAAKRRRSSQPRPRSM